MASSIAANAMTTRPRKAGCAQSRANVVAYGPAFGEGGEGLAVCDELVDVAPGDLWRRGRGDVVEELGEIVFGVWGEADRQAHEPARCAVIR